MSQIRIKTNDTPQERQTLALAKAVQKNDLDAASEALGSGASAKGFTTKGNPDPLIFAKSKEMASLLIKNGASVHKRSEHTEGPAGARVKMMNTPLHYANEEVADVLLRNGARVDAMNARGETPLHRASLAGDAGKCRLLLEHGADPNATLTEGYDGTTPLHHAKTVEVARVLVEGGADPHRMCKAPGFRDPMNAVDYAENLKTIRPGVADFLRSEVQRQQLESATLAAGSWSPTDADADALLPEGYSQDAPVQQRSRRL